MIYATEFPAVQQALGISVSSEISEKPYADADRFAIASGRLKIREKEISFAPGEFIWAVFVDGNLVLYRAGGETFVAKEVDAAELAGVLQELS